MDTKTMNTSFKSLVILLLLLIFSFAGCKSGNHSADIPDIQSIYENISYLDSLVRSNQVDSISIIHDQIASGIISYTSRARSPEDKAILDSLTHINLVTGDFLSFCTGTQTNLELLKQDTRSLESDYKSGKIKIAFYISTLLEDEQILIDINNQFTSKGETVLKYLKHQSPLVEKLHPLFVEGK